MSRTRLYCMIVGGLLSPCAAYSQEATSPGQRDDAAATTSRQGIETLDAVSVTANGRPGFAPPANVQATKTDIPLSRTPQSISVVNRALIDSQQARTINDALVNVAGVVSNTWGRDYRDDYVIRGQRASESEYLDGMLVGPNNPFSAIAQELFGVESLEILKGPSSIAYGRVQPGGLVNLVSKTPQATPFASVSASLGTQARYQGTVDVNTPFSGDGRNALRLTGLVYNSDGVTKQVWEKNRYIAPSLSLGLGERTDVVILGSYSRRDYLRQQGLPPSGTVLPNQNGKVAFDLFNGDPNQLPYRTEQERLGYLLTHRFNDDWTLHHNLRWQHGSLDGDFVANGPLGADQALLPRNDSRQRYVANTFTTTDYLEGHVRTGRLDNHFTTGFDYVDTSERLASRNCTMGALNVFDPVYGIPVTCPAVANSDTTTRLRDLGVYLRNQLLIDERWQITLGLRRDTTTTRIRDDKRGVTTRSSADANTGNAALMYYLTPRLRPYLSYATSFVPNSGIDVNGHGFLPDKGRQSEAGAKIDLPRDGGTLVLSLYDLNRNNVLAADPDNPGFSIAVGEQRSRGLEAEWVADFHNGFSVSTAYAYTLASVVHGIPASQDNRPLDNVPRNNFSLWTTYQFGGRLSGLRMGTGIQAQSRKRGFDFDYTIPGYVVGNAMVSYASEHWHTALNVNNLLNRKYYAAGLNANAVGIGNPRMAMWTIGLDY